MRQVIATYAAFVASLAGACGDKAKYCEHHGELGPPPVDADAAAETPYSPFIDADDDGYTPAQGDCDDTDPNVLPSWFVDEAGAVTDLSRAFRAGTPHTPAKYSIPSAGTLTFCDGTWHVSLYSRGNQRLHIKSQHGSEVTTLDGAGRHQALRSFETQRVHVSGLTFRNGHAMRGGALHVADGHLSIEDCVFETNRATGSKDAKGGAVWMYEGNIDVWNSTFSRNGALPDHPYDGGGGALSLYEGTISIADSLFDQNIATGSGGAISLYSGSLGILNSSILRNSALCGSGGGVHLHSGAAMVEQSTLSMNSASSHGGAIHSYDAVVVLEETTVHTNDALHGGGASTFEGFVVSMSSHWGNGGTDNTPDDVYVEASELGLSDLAAFETFACSPGACGE